MEKLEIECLKCFNCVQNECLEYGNNADDAIKKCAVDGFKNYVMLDKSMERLTEKGENRKTPRGMARHFCTINSISKQMLRDMYCEQYDKLQKLEDIIEQIGMSIEGFYKCIMFNEDKFYIIVENDDNECHEIVEVLKNDDYMHYFIQGGFYFAGESEKGMFYEYPISCYGKDLFLTYEEAEKKLEEMKNEENI